MLQSFLGFFALFAVILNLSAFAMENSRYRYELAICAIFQNEAPYLKEWIEFHKLMGIQHFYLYNHLSQDHYLEILLPYLEEGSVELVDWTEPNFQGSGQKKSYMHAIKKARGKVKWLAILDIDEYLVPKVHDSVLDLLAEYEEEGIGGLAVNWQMFGTSFVANLQADQLLTEELTLKAVEEHSENIHIKSIVRPEYVVEPPHVHYFEYIKGYSQVNSNKEPFRGSFSPYIAVDKIQINHYWTKDEAFFVYTKIPRRLAWGEVMEVIEKRLNALNQVEDTSIQRFMPLLREKMFAPKMIGAPSDCVTNIER